ncbi:MAG: CopG family ribbon-helix-helix protein [Desulfobacterales bacterium]|jgi:predicted transcriptional regulator
MKYGLTALQAERPIQPVPGSGNDILIVCPETDRQRTYAHVGLIGDVPRIYNLKDPIFHTLKTCVDKQMESIPVSSRVDKAVSEKLDMLSKATSRSRSFLISEAIRAYVEEQAWQIEAIKEGVKQADQGKFASSDKVRKTFAKFGVNIDKD